MRTRRQSATVFGLVAAAALTAGAWAQSTPPADDAGALSGPKVTPARETTRTLVQRDFDGKLKRIDGDPIAAALDLLDLDKDNRAAADAVLATRSEEIDVLVRDHLKEIAELANARQAGDQARARELMRGILQAAAPMLRKGPLVDQVAAALPTNNGAELKRLVEEYTKAGVEDRMDNGTTDGAPAARPGNRAGRPNPMQANMAERLQGFGQELRRSYERVFGNRAADFQKLVKDLDLTPEQEAKVQRIFTDLFQKTYGKPSPSQRTKAFFDAYKLMNDEQRARFREMVASTREGGGETDPMGDSPQPPEDIPTPPKPESKPDRKP